MVWSQLPVAYRDTFGEGRRIPRTRVLIKRNTNPSEHRLCRQKTHALAGNGLPARRRPGLQDPLEALRRRDHRRLSRPGGAQAELLAEVNKHEADRNLQLVLTEFRNYQQGILPAPPPSGR
jgi:hypothetical protein